MKCSNCGAKTLVKDKFCSKCGAAVNVKNSQVPSQNGRSVPQNTVSNSRRGNLVPSLIIAIIFVFLFSYILSIAGSAQSGSYSMLFDIIGTILLVWLVIALIVRLIKFIIRKPLAGIITTVVLIAIIILPLSFYMFTVRDNRTQGFDALQNSSTELYVLRALGDDIWTGSSVPSGTSMKGISERAKVVSAQIDGLAVDGNFSGYKTALKNWADSINQAADSGNWQTLSAVPDLFTSGISQQDAETYFEKSMDQVVNSKSYGDWIIYVKDRQAMRYVTAELQTQDYFLSGIMSNLESASVVSFNLVEPAFATKYTHVCQVTRNKVGAIITNTCWNKAAQAIPKLVKDSRGYTLGDPLASEEWTNDWNELGQSVSLPEATPIGGAGITYGEPSAPKNSPMVEEFFNECKAKGGNTSPASLVKTRLPTSEGGHDCAYGNGCWDTLTYSGRRFMGGNTGCPELGLVPQPFVIPNPIPNIIPDIIPNPGPTPTENWDGTYSLVYSLSCSVPGVGSVPTPSTSETITVRNGRFTPSGGSSTSISSSGQAQSSMSVSESGAYGKMVDTYQFSHNGSGVTVRGTRSFSGGGNETVDIPGFQGYSGESFSGYSSISCSGTISGSRR